MTWSIVKWWQCTLNVSKHTPTPTSSPAPIFGCSTPKPPPDNATTEQYFTVSHMSVQTLRGLCRLHRLSMDYCNCPKWNLKWLPVVGYWVCTLPLCHCGLLYPANMCYICKLWLNWETYFLLLNMGHIIYGHDSFFDVNSMAVSISRSD